MARTTRATQTLDAAGVSYELHAYTYETGPNIGARAAEALGVDPGQVLKTLMVKVDGKPACVVTPSDGEVSLKKVAAALGGKGAIMMPVPEAEKATGYVVGGISPIGQRKKVPTVVNERAELYDRVFVNGGGRGLQVLLPPGVLVGLLDAVVADLD